MGKNNPNKKTEEKKKAKIVEDKTFGLKNKKKSKKVQEYVKSVEQQVYNKSLRKEEEKKFQKKEEKKKKAEEMALLGFLQKSLGGDKKKQKAEEAKEYEEQKIAEATIDDKTAAINIYADPRDPDPTRSPKVCDHFLEACEKNVYGWRWQCPNGGSKCQYTHALPEGYMLKSTMEALMKMQREEDAEKAKEYWIEEERAKLDPDKCTPINEETFNAWRKKRREKFLQKRKQKEKEAQTAVRGKGNKSVFLSGRALLKFDPNMFKTQEDDEDDDDEEEKYEKKDEGDDGEVLELNFGIDEEEEEFNKEIEAAKKLNVVNEELFQDEEDNVDLDDLE